MPTFTYKATNQKGELVTDTITAASEKEAETLLKDKKLKVLVLKSEKAKKNLVPFLSFKKFPIQEKINLCRYLTVMINAGLPLGEAFDILIQGTPSQTVKKVVADISSGLTKGQSLHSSFAKYPQYFGEIFLAMVKTGEASGSLNESFQHLALQYQQENELRKKVVSALLYPAIILLLMTCLGILMFTFVLPRLGNVYLRLNLELPFLTKILFKFSLFLEKNMVLLFISTLISAIGIFFFAKSKPGKRLFFALAGKTPILKKILLEYNLVRFTQSLSALLKAGVPIGQALEIASKSLNLAEQEELSQSFKDKVSRGLPLSIVFTEAKIFPALMTGMVAVGEKTGKLDQLLVDVSSFYQEEIGGSLKNFVSLLEPLLMILVGVAVGIMVLAFVTPIYNLIGQLQSG